MSTSETDTSEDEDKDDHSVDSDEDVVEPMPVEEKETESRPTALTGSKQPRAPPPPPPPPKPKKQGGGSISENPLARSVVTTETTSTRDQPILRASSLVSPHASPPPAARPPSFPSRAPSVSRSSALDEVESGAGIDKLSPSYFAENLSDSFDVVEQQVEAGIYTTKRAARLIRKV